jgi:hypothetical protein
MLWKLVIFAETEAEHDATWARLCREFEDQMGYPKLPV